MDSNIYALKINFESLEMMLKFGGICILILMLVFFLAVITPKLAKITDNIRAKGKKKTDVTEKAENDDYNHVRGIYDPQYPKEESGTEITDDGDVKDGER